MMIDRRLGFNKSLPQRLYNTSDAEAAATTTAAICNPPDRPAGKATARIKY